MGKSLLLGLLAIVGLGLVSACLYFSRSPKPWQWGPQQAGTPIGPRPYYGIEEQNRMIEAIYQVGAPAWGLAYNRSVFSELFMFPPPCLARRERV